MKYRIDCVGEYGEWFYRAVLIHGRSEYKSETRYSTYAAAVRAARKITKENVDEAA